MFVTLDLSNCLLPHDQIPVKHFWQKYYVGNVSYSVHYMRGQMTVYPMVWNFNLISWLGGLHQVVLLSGNFSFILKNDCDILRSASAIRITFVFSFL